MSSSINVYSLYLTKFLRSVTSFSKLLHEAKNISLTICRMRYKLKYLLTCAFSKRRQKNKWSPPSNSSFKPICVRHLWSWIFWSFISFNVRASLTHKDILSFIFLSIEVSSDDDKIILNNFLHLHMKARELECCLSIWFNFLSLSIYKATKFI